MRVQILSKIRIITIVKKIENDVNKTLETWTKLQRGKKTYQDSHDIAEDFTKYFSLFNQKFPSTTFKGVTI